MLLGLTNISKIFNGEVLLNNVSLSVEENSRIGIIGANGCGKTTLFRIICGQTEPDRQTERDGIISKASKISIGFLEQNCSLDTEMAVFDEMKTAFSDIEKIKTRMSELEHAMERRQPNEAEITREYGGLIAQFEARDGWNIDVKIKTVLNGMGFGEEVWQRKINSFSGGEKTRLAICKLLLEEPNLLMLDEPTNHLDFRTVMWLENYLSSYKGALLIISHDRYFLDKTVNCICEIENGVLRSYKGNYTQFTELKAQYVAQQMKEYEEQQKEIAKLEDYVARNLVRASTTKMAQSRRTALEKIERIEKPKCGAKPLRLRFEQKCVPPFDLLDVRDVEIAVGRKTEKKVLVSSVSFELKRGERLGIVGENGTGKSTFLKILQNMLPYEGKIRWADNVKLSYFEQESAQLDFEKTAFEEIHSRMPAMSDFEVRCLLGSVLITGEEVFKKVGNLSGGERVKLSFAVMQCEKGNVMIFDEPTNHLDIAAKESLEKAISEFEGTVIVVSHDRYLLKSVCTSILELSCEKGEFFPYGFEKYAEITQEREREKQLLIDKEKQISAALKAKEKGNSIYRSKQQRALDAQKRNRINMLEREMEKLQILQNELEAELARQEVFSDYVLMQTKCRELENAKYSYNEMFDEWATLCEDDS